MTSSGPVDIVPVAGIPEIHSGDDLAAAIEPGLLEAGVDEGDVVVVTSKIVSKAEGRLVPDHDRDDTIAAQTTRVVARRGDLMIAETSHGFVCANAGVDASNVDAGSLALLPEDPDGSARALR
ncbi:MAG TPA: coenzyme F420-0:L-glutamate ligase, partial [Actinomycetota bacterium]